MTTSSPRPQVEAGFDLKSALRAYWEILSRNRARIGPDSRLKRESLEESRAVAIEAARYFKTELDPHFDQWSGMNIREIAAATDADDLGTLSGALVLQRSLPLFKYQFPVLGALYTDFSATPGVFNQTTNTRIVTVPSVQKFDETNDTDGRPLGWNTVIPAQTTDAPVTLDEYVGVPIIFSAQTLASTIRRLFDEIGPAAVYAIAKYYVAKMAALITPANYNAYAVVKTGVPDAYVSYASSQKNFSMDAIDDLEAILDANEIPASERGVPLNAKYYGQLRRDPRLGLFFAAAREPGIIEQGQLPGRLDGFEPFRAPWLPTPNNLVGFAFNKAAIILKQRLPTDFTTALNTAVPGSVTTIVDPDSGLSCLLVQYINLQRGYAEWRVETLLGAAVGDKRGALCITSQ
jgi:hypothetical protein